MDELNGIVRQVVQVSPNMKVFRIAPIGWELPDFKPGQFVGIGLPASSPRCPEATDEMPIADESKIIKRAYSIASSNTSNREQISRFKSVVSSIGHHHRSFVFHMLYKIDGPELNGLLVFVGHD